MATKYPIILAHGIMIKEWKRIKAFGRIEKVLKAKGYHVYTAKTDGVGRIETNAQQLKECIDELLHLEKAEKVNIIAHSKGGLDARYMIDCLGMSEKVASVTFLCTPHKGSQIATKLYALPKFIRNFIAFWMNFWYRLFGDKHPDVLEACRQLSFSPDGVLENFGTHNGIYMQSYAATLKKSTDDFVMGIPLLFSKKFESEQSDGVVCEESAKFGEYKGYCIDDSVSHTQIVDFLTRREKREKIYTFYIDLCTELASKGY